MREKTLHFLAILGEKSLLILGVKNKTLREIAFPKTNIKMKYTRLTKEQFEALHTEFSNFLASQQIDKKEWDDIKANKPEIADQELDVFSDLIWEGVLSNAKFLEHYSKNHIFLFKILDHEMITIVIKSNQNDVNFLTKEGLNWLAENLFTNNIELKTGAKAFETERNLSIFEFIKQGSILSDGALFNQINDILNKAN